MKSLKSISTVLIMFLGITTSNAQKKTKISARDFKPLIGTWEGSLTYLDYSSGKPYTMPANLDIKQIRNTNQFLLSNIYPNEKSANSIDTLKISSDGKFIGKELVTSKKRLKDGSIEIITEREGTDGNDNKPAIIRYTYTISNSLFTKRKDVQFQGEIAWIKRHEYTYRIKTSK